MMGRPAFIGGLWLLAISGACAAEGVAPGGPAGDMSDAADGAWPAMDPNEVVVPDPETAGSSAADQGMASDDGASFGSADGTSIPSEVPGGESSAMSGGTDPGTDPSMDSAAPDAAPDASEPATDPMDDGTMDPDVTDPADTEDEVPADDAPPSNPDDPYDALRETCVETINMYREMLGVPPVQRASPEQEACSDMGAQQDAETGDVHGSANSCFPRGPMSQNTCPSWGFGGPFSPYDDLEGALRGCLAQMWAEGEPPEGTEACLRQYFEGDRECYLAHGHYINMKDPNVTKVACGFYDMGNNTFWMNQDFGT